MRIKIRKDARHHSAYLCREYAEQLRQIEGKWIKVETNYVFAYQYNTSPIPGVAVNGLRIYDEVVSQIDYEGDEVLEKVHQAMRLGAQPGGIVCHSYRHDIKEIVDPTLVTEEIRRLLSVSTGN